MVDVRILRERLEASREEGLRRIPVAENGAVAILAQTTAVASYPTVAGAFYACSPLLVDGPETEGAAASFATAGTRTVFALNVGKGVPPAGTKIIAHSCGGRWIFRFDG